MKGFLFLCLVAACIANMDQTTTQMILDLEAGGCTCQTLGDGYCDYSCDTSTCKYDNHDCCHGDCVYGCKLEKLADGICDSECNYECCSYDGGDCK